LDVDFREDYSRKRAGNAAQNFTLLNRFAVNLLKNEKTIRVGVRGKRLKAGWDNKYTMHGLVLNIGPMAVPAENTEYLKHQDTKNTERGTAERRVFSVALVYEGYTECHREDTAFHRGTPLCVLRVSVVI
jgi:hypothetical protein